jgi:hypothetical protein
MPSGFNIEEKDRVPYEKSVKDPDPNIPMEETLLRAAIIAWANSEEPDGGDWIYSWNANLTNTSAR